MTAATNCFSTHRRDELQYYDLGDPVQRRLKFAELSTGLKFTGLFARLKIESHSRCRTAGDVATPTFVPTILSRAQCGGAATEPHKFIASPEGVRRWLIYSFNARTRVHSLQPVLRPSGFCSKAFRACPFRCIAQPAVKCTNGCRKTHRSTPHD